MYISVYPSTRKVSLMSRPSTGCGLIHDQDTLELQSILGILFVHLSGLKKGLLEL